MTKYDNFVRLNISTAACTNMWAQITYKLDNETVLVPLSKFKECEKVKSELAEHKIRDHYLVFWSNRDEDSPESLRKREGNILVQDSVLNFVSGTLREKGHTKPPAGWYAATIKQWEESLEALKKVLDGPYVRKRKISEIIKVTEAEVAPTLKRQLRSCAVQKNGKASDFKDSDSKKSLFGDDDRENVPFFEYKHVVDRLEKLEAEHGQCASLQNSCNAARMLELEEEVKTLQEVNKELLQINLKWQKKYWSSSKSASSSSLKTATMEFSKKDVLRSPKGQIPAGSVNVHTSLEKLSGTSEETMSCIEQVDSSSFLPHSSSISMPTPLTQVNSSVAVLAPPGTQIPEGQPSSMVFHAKRKPRSSSANLGGITFDSQKFEDFFKDKFSVTGPRITIDQFQAVADVVPAGKNGDSLFYKHCSKYFWSDAELNHRSVSGCPCPTDLTKDTKPACSPVKKKFLRDILEFRINSETVPVDEAARQERLKESVLNGYLRGKIKAVNRYFKTQQNSS